MWMGVPAAGGFRMVPRLDTRFHGENDTMAFPVHASNISSVKFSSPSLVTDGVFYLPDNVPVTASQFAAWDDSIVQILWNRI